MLVVYKQAVIQTHAVVMAGFDVYEQTQKTQMRTPSATPSMLVPSSQGDLT